MNHIKAVNIEWDTDDAEIALPSEILIPDEIKLDTDAISDYISDYTGFCHFGFELKPTKLLHHINHKAMNTLVEAISNSNTSDIEDFLGYCISADILEDIETHIANILSQMPDDEINKYMIKFNILETPQISTRPSKNEYYLDIARAVAARSTCLRRRYGAVLVKNDEIVATGYNGSPRGEINCCDEKECLREKLNIPKGERYELCVAIHAEDNAITSAGREKSKDATLYIFGINADGTEANPAPCAMCRRKIVNAGIKTVIGCVNGEPEALDVSLSVYTKGK